MRKNLNLIGCCLCALLLLSSCYSSTVCVGKMKPNQEGVCVGTSHNSHFIAGLVGSKKMRAKDYVENQPDYKIKTYHSFVDGLIASITFSLYTPTTTKFYVPAKAAKKMRKKGRAYDDDDDDD